MSNLKENLLQKSIEMEIHYDEQIHLYRGYLKGIKSGRNKMWESNLLRSETLKQFWGNLKTALEAGVYEN